METAEMEHVNATYEAFFEVLAVK